MDPGHYGKYKPSHDEYDEPPDFEPDDEGAILQQWQEEQATIEAFDMAPPDDEDIPAAGTTTTSSSVAVPIAAVGLSSSKKQLSDITAVYKPFTTDSLVDTMLNAEYIGKKSLIRGEGKKTPKEIAQLMHDEREKIFGSHDVQQPIPQSSMESCLELATAAEHVTVATDAAYFLSPLPDLTMDTTTIAFEKLLRPCVLADGSRQYIKFRNNTYSRQSPSSSTYSPSSSFLLGKSMNELMREAEQLQVKAVMARMNAGEEESLRSVTFSSSVHNNNSTGAEKNGGSTSTSSSDLLWVDKYTPRSFSQLLSPEKVNREVLKSLKRWDPFVFKTPKQTTLANQKVANPVGSAIADDPIDLRPKLKAIMLCGPPGTGKTTLAHIVAHHCGYRVIEVNASDDRSPDMLKETLARATQSHSLATHSQGSPDNNNNGTYTYNNNSSSSSAAAAKGPINTKMTLCSQPNCIILDEIDGIDGRHTIDVLVGALTAPLRSRNHAASASSSYSSSQQQPLTRPLICICNDPYTPALRDLRRHCEVFVFSSPNESRLTQRLKTVCVAEGLHVANTQFLSDLCSASGQDIRASINNLQFVALRASEQRNREDITSSEISNQGKHMVDIDATLASMIKSGLKDDQCDIYQVWKNIFTHDSSLVQKAKTHISGGVRGTESSTAAIPLVYSSPNSNETSSSSALGMESLTNSMRAMELMTNCGDYGIITPGLFENIHSIPYGAADASLVSATHTTEWFSFTDSLNSFMLRMPGGFTVMQYVPAVAGAVNYFTATRDQMAARRLRIEWPKKDREVAYKQLRNTNILTTLLESCAQRRVDNQASDIADSDRTSKVPHSRTQIVLDVIPYLIDVICPRVRPLMMITMSPVEQSLLMDSVRAMESYGLSYVSQSTNSFGGPQIKRVGWQRQQQAEDKDASMLQLDPAVNELIRFEAGCEPHSSAVDDALLLHRHCEVSPELRMIIYTEQRHFAIQSKIGRVLHKQMNSPAAVAAAAAKQSSTIESVGVGLQMDGIALAVRADGDIGVGETVLDSALTKRQNEMGASSIGISIGINGSGSMSSNAIKKQRVEPPSSVPVPIVPTAPPKQAFSFRKAPAGGKQKVAASAAAEAATAIRERKKTEIRFKFSQGFSDAVRRVVTIKEFL